VCEDHAVLITWHCNIVWDARQIWHN